MKIWRKYNGALVPLSPPHIDVDVIDIDKKINDTNSYFARWTSDFDSKLENSFWYVINDVPMTIEDYSRNTRSKIRRGLKSCAVKLVTRSEIKEFGFTSYRKAFLRYNTNISPKNHADFMKEIDDLDGKWHFWAIYNINNVIIGYSQNKITDNYCDYSTIKFHPDFLHIYSSYALFYTMNQYYLNENNFRYVNDGAKSMSHDTNIQAFLIQKFKFRKAYCKLHLYYPPKIHVIVNFLFPLRFLISKIKFGVFKKINVLLNHEYIVRLPQLRVIDEISPIIIIGAARSGTHLIATSIQKNINCIYLNEINDLWRDQFLFMKSDEITSDIITDEKVFKTRNNFNNLLNKKESKKYLLEKTASNCLRLDLVYRVFPNAKFIHISRDGKPVSVSVRKKYFGNIHKISSDNNKKDSSLKQRFKVVLLELRHKYENGVSLLVFLSNIVRYLKMSSVILGIKKQDFWGPRFIGYKDVMRKVSPLELAVIQWKQSKDRLGIFMKKLDKSQFISLKYEDLILNPKEEMFKVLDFVLEKKFDGKLFHEIKNTRLMSWKDGLTNTEINFLEKKVDNNES
tara:strand:- start:837 stop:2540 length:1704 start_codon:yes stop_codon:yes gene_type:complete